MCLVGWYSPTYGSDWRDDVGYTKLISILGNSAPNGAGVPISLVEAAPEGSTAYFPIVLHGFFAAAADPEGTAVNFIDGSGGESNGVSSHAFEQAVRFFGNTTSVAEAANEVTVYEANNYLNVVLNLDGTNTSLPNMQDFRVQNFSWIGTLNSNSEDREALRRFDYAINANNITALVGLGNGTGDLPFLLSHSYNSIAVGRSDGIHSSGLTRLADYGIGRSKPDLVAPEGSTSTATSITSSVVTFLHSADTVLGTDAAKSQTMKAILLTGATKEEFPTWSQVDAGGQWRPLDDTYGAGELNLYNSYLVTLGGQTVGSTTSPTPVTSHGWDYQTIQPGEGNELLYDFVIPTGSTAKELSIVLAWNAQIESPFNSGAPIVANLGLELVDDNGMTIDLDITDSLVEGLSNSDVDNVEHLYLTDLASGTYTLKVFSDDLASDFGLAWRTSTLFDAFSADFDGDGDTDGADFLAWQRGSGMLVGAATINGDADGDGDVDAEDLAIFSSTFASGNTTQFLSAALAVPEPATLAQVFAGLLIGLGLKCRQSIRLSR